MRIVCQDMFFARSRSTGGVARGLGANVPAGVNPLDAAFKNTNTMGEKVNVVGDLVNIKVSGPVDTDFSLQVWREACCVSEEGGK